MGTSLRNNKILLMGPFFGSFEYEVVMFRPYITWVKQRMTPLKSYVYTHFNRSFLYDGIIEKDNICPIYKQFTRDEMGQNYHFHDSVDMRDFRIFVKSLKDDISKKEGCNKKDIATEGTAYTKSSVYYPVHRRIFNRIEVNESDVPSNLRNRKIFIPVGDELESLEIYKYLRSVDRNFVVIGDMKTPLKEYNVLLRRLDYFENVWKYIVGMITYSEVVVCPISYWTFLCNTQHAKVISWGDNPGLYKDGVYGFGNPNAIILPYVDIKKFIK
jgi:hypothetical protein